jgi:peptidoglycan hydrolase CwlO-like protein
MSAAGAIETIHQFLTTKYPGVFLLFMAFAFAWLTTSKLNDLDQRVYRIENVDLPGIRQDIKEMREDIKDLEVRVTRLEVKVDNIEKKLDELTIEMKELRADVKELTTKVNTMLIILSPKKNP